MALGIKGRDVLLFHLEVACGQIGCKEFANSMFAVGDGWDLNQLAM